MLDATHGFARSGATGCARLGVSREQPERQRARCVLGDAFGGVRGAPRRRDLASSAGTMDGVSLRGAVPSADAAGNAGPHGRGCARARALAANRVACGPWVERCVPRPVPACGSRSRHLWRRAAGGVGRGASRGKDGESVTRLGPRERLRTAVPRGSGVLASALRLRQAQGVPRGTPREVLSVGRPARRSHQRPSDCRSLATTIPPLPTGHGQPNVPRGTFAAVPRLSPSPSNPARSAPPYVAGPRARRRALDAVGTARPTDRMQRGWPPRSPRPFSANAHAAPALPPASGARLRSPYCDPVHRARRGREVPSQAARHSTASAAVARASTTRRWRPRYAQHERKRGAEPVRARASTSRYDRLGASGRTPPRSSRVSARPAKGGTKQTGSMGDTSCFRAHPRRS